MRGLALALGLLALAAFAATAALVYRSERDAAVPSAGWFVGPSGRALEAAATERIAGAIEALSGPEGSAPGGLDRYRAELGVAADLLARSLRARPTEPRTLARLAAVRWEIESALGSGDVEVPLRMIELASRAAPDAPAVQSLLGDLLLRMGRHDEALARLRRTVELDPARAPQVVRSLRENLVPAAEILEALPRSGSLLRALATPFVQDGIADPYLAALEEAIRGGDAGLLATYSDVAFRAGAAARVAAFADALPAFPDPAAESDRLLARSRARLAGAQPEVALADARRAAELQPGSSRILEQWGRAALAAGDAGDAVDAFRDALQAAALEGASVARRAQLTRQIGQAEDRAGRPDRAFDAYVKTLELEPGDPHARRRIAEMRRAAGVHEEP